MKEIFPLLITFSMKKINEQSSKFRNFPILNRAAIDKKEPVGGRAEAEGKERHRMAVGKMNRAAGVAQQGPHLGRADDLRLRQRGEVARDERGPLPDRVVGRKAAVGGLGDGTGQSQGDQDGA